MTQYRGQIGARDTGEPDAPDLNIGARVTEASLIRARPDRYQLTVTCSLSFDAERWNCQVAIDVYLQNIDRVPSLFGDAIRRKRVANRVSLKDLAERVDVTAPADMTWVITPSLVSDIERGAIFPPQSLAYILAREVGYNAREAEALSILAEQETSV